MASDNNAQLSQYARFPNSNHDPRNFTMSQTAPSQLPSPPQNSYTSYSASPHTLQYQHGAAHTQSGHENGRTILGGYHTSGLPPPSHPSYASYQSCRPATVASDVESLSRSAKKKNTRASVACNLCRQIKAKCDEEKPCKTCRDKNMKCEYRISEPTGANKTQEDIKSIKEDVKLMRETLFGNSTGAIGEAQSDVTDGGNELLQQNTPGLVDRLEILFGMVKQLREFRTSTSPIANEDRSFIDDIKERQHFNDGPQYHSDPSAECKPSPEGQSEVEPGSPLAPSEPAIPMNHTTPAGQLLQWRAIVDIIKPHLSDEDMANVEDYPISLEKNRGVLSVYGRGEDSYSPRHKRRVTDHRQFHMADDSSDTASPSADWVHLGKKIPADQVIEYKGGVLASDGNPDFSESTVWAYVKSFQEHILNMHPIIRPKDLYDWVQHFLNTLPSTAMHSKCPNQGGKGASFTVGNLTMTKTTGTKRKRSLEEDGLEVPSTPSPGRSGGPERSIHNALVLTILALGKICQHRDRIYDAVHQVEPVPHGIPLTRNGIPPSPSQGSPPSLSSHSYSSRGPLESPGETEQDFQCRRSSIHGSSVAGTSRGGLGLKKNYEAIPGLEYFAFATDILGNHTGSYKTMKHVYALIFAGLYHGQLARPMDSFAFISQASHKLQAIMEPCLGELAQIKLAQLESAQIKSSRVLMQDPEHNQMALAFWSCLQLESDLIAEIQLPPSWLLYHEDQIPHPNMSLLDGFDQRVLDSYLAQLYLRKHLNSIHRTFYAPDMEQTDAEELDHKFFTNVKLISDGVTNMQWVTESFAFGEEDPPADDILAARLRAKYWGAQVITYRPSIRQILRWSENIRNHPSSPNMQPVSEFRPGVTAPVIDPAAKSLKDIEPITIEYAKRGIKALIESTRAFHGLGAERPIITNVFGTAHAQWGNLLVLSACFKNDVLSSQVDASLLQTLFAKTIQFLRQSSTETGSLRTDMRILKGIQRDLFPPGGVDTNMTGSFSSNASLQTPKFPMAAPPAHMTNPM